MCSWWTLLLFAPARIQGSRCQGFSNGLTAPRWVSRDPSPCHGKHRRAAAWARRMCYQCVMPRHHSNSPFCRLEICTAGHCSASRRTRGKQRPCSQTSPCSKRESTHLEDDWVLMHQNLHSLCLPIASHTNTFLKIHAWKTTENYKKQYTIKNRLKSCSCYSVCSPTQKIPKYFPSFLVSKDSISHTTSFPKSSNSETLQNHRPQLNNHVGSTLILL